MAAMPRKNQCPGYLSAHKARAVGVHYVHLVVSRPCALEGDS